MLTDTALRNLKPKSKAYKAFDRDGMYVTVSTTGTVTFRYDYHLNGRRETLTIGRYGPAGLSLALAREKLIDANKAVAQGKSPALEKQREKRRLTAAKTFGEMTVKWLAGARMADSTKAMRKSIVDRDILPVFQNRQLNEITADDLRVLCNKVKARGAPATAVHIRDIVKQVYAFAILHGEKVGNPAADVGAASIATFVPKDRALSPLEIRLMARQMESVATYPTIRLALRMILLTLVRKGELIQATWDEVDFEKATWTMPKQRMKGRKNRRTVNPSCGSATAEDRTYKLAFALKDSRIAQVLSHGWQQGCLPCHVGRSPRTLPLVMTVIVECWQGASMAAVAQVDDRYTGLLKVLGIQDGAAPTVC